MSAVTAPKPPHEPALPFADGDRLSAEEFMRRYEGTPDLKHVELLEGIVHMPINPNLHGSEQGALITWAGVYAAYTPQVKTSGPGTLKLDRLNVPEPDGMLWLKPECGGQVTYDEDLYLVGAPEMAIEIATSSKARDLGVKFTVYQRNGVKEYIVWRVKDGELDWYVSRHGKFVLLIPDANGLIRSEVFPGLWLDVAALLAGDRTRLIQVLDQGLHSEEHRRFVAGS